MFFFFFVYLFGVDLFSALRSPLSVLRFPLSRVGVFVGIFQVLSRHVGVDFGGAEVAVSEEFFDGVDVGAFVEQMGREAVAEDVGADPVSLG